MNNLEKLKQLLLKYSFRKGDFILASGKKSNFYFDGKQTSLHPEGAFLIGTLIFEIIQKKFPEVQAVGGPTLGADPLLTSVSLASYHKHAPLFSFIVRKEPKGHGTGAWIEGNTHLKPGMKVILVEDVITTGGSLLKAAEKVREFGLTPVGVIVLVDRQEGGQEAVQQSGMQFVSLFTKDELLNTKD